MKQLLFNSLLVITVASLLSSCEGPPPIDVSIDTPPQKLVVASQIIPNQVMVVGVTKSFSALENEANGSSVTGSFLDGILVTDAIVTVSYMNQTDTLQMLTPGVYVSLNTLLFDYGVYTLNVKDIASGMEVSAQTTMLPHVSFDEITPSINPDTSVVLNFSFTDDPSTENYYVVNYYKKVSGTGNGFDINSYFQIGTNQLITDFELLSDKTFENNHYSQEKTFPSDLVSRTDTIAVALSNISKGYYDFLYAYKRSGQIFNQITGEPINYPTNVIDGYGYFNTHYPDARIFDLNDY